MRRIKLMEHKTSSYKKPPKREPAEKKPGSEKAPSTEEKQLSTIDKIKKFLSSKPTKKQTLIISGVVVGVVGLVFLGVYLSNQRRPDPNLEPIVKQEIEEIEIVVTEPSKLTGVQVLPELNDRAVTGIMIENSIDARPQAGLVSAGVVFEAIAEGGITRFLALYQEAQPAHIGPIRSARPYYVRWAAGFDAAYVHSGGSGEALSLIRTLGVNDLDHGNYPGYFDRVSNRYAPHNVYTSMERLDSLRAATGFSSSSFDEFARIVEVEESTDGETAEKVVSKNKKAVAIEFNISGQLYNTRYAYNSETNKYARAMGGQPHLDEKTGKQVSPSVVIALETVFGFHPDGVHSTYNVVGGGNVTVFQNGEIIKGTWSKASDTASLKFKTLNGKALKLQPGQTWITVVPSGRVSYAP